MTREAAMRIRDALQGSGWRDIQALFREHIDEPRKKLAHLMAHDPDKLTGKTALKYAIRASAIEDLLEEIFDSQKILPQS